MAARLRPCLLASASLCAGRVARAPDSSARSLRMDSLTFTDTPRVSLGGNLFINVPIVWQHDDTPMIQIVRQVTAGFTTEIPIYNKDGHYIAKVVGSRIVPGFEIQARDAAPRQTDDLRNG